MISLSSVLLLIFLPYTASAIESVTAEAAADTLRHSEITVSRVIKEADRTTYVILDENRLKSFDIYSLFDQIPNVNHDNITDKITVNGREEIAFTVDGVEVSRQELLALSPKQVKSISVIHAPKGKYVSRGIRYVIEVHKKKGNGILADVRNSLFIAPDNVRTIANEQPGIQMQYSRDKLNINAGYVFGDICWGYDKYETRRLPDGTEYASIHPGGNRPEELSTTSGHSAYLRASYDFNEKHSLSVSAAYSRNDISTDYNTLLENMNTGMSFNEVSECARTEDNMASSATYNASLSEKVSMSLSANWNRISSPERYTYMCNGVTEEFSRHGKSKDYSFQNLDFTYDITDAVSLNFGVNNIYNRYRIQDMETGITVLDRKSIRFDTYGYVTWGIRDDLALNGGISAGYVKDDVTDRFYAAPLLSLTYYPESVFGLSATYSIEPSYPTREELNPVLRQLGEDLYMQGNPDLPSVSLTHSFLLQMTFWDNLMFTNYFSGTPDLISDYYAMRGNDIVSTFSPAKHWYNVSGIDYDWKISRNWSWKNSVQLNIIKTFNEEYGNRDIEIMGESSIGYFSPRLKLFSQLRYSRALSRIPTIQGFSETGFDMWDLTVNKYLFKDRLVLSLNYIIPLKIGIRNSQKKEVNTPYYFRHDELDLGIYDNMIIFRLAYRFGNGHKTKGIEDNTRYDNEAADSRGLL